MSARTMDEGIWGKLFDRAMARDFSLGFGLQKEGKDFGYEELMMNEFLDKERSLLVVSKSSNWRVCRKWVETESGWWCGCGSGLEVVWELSAVSERFNCVQRIWRQNQAFLGGMRHLQKWLPCSCSNQVLLNITGIISWQSLWYFTTRYGQLCWSCTPSMLGLLCHIDGYIQYWLLQKSEVFYGVWNNDAAMTYVRSEP